MYRNYGIGDEHQGDDGIWPCGSDGSDDGRSGSDITWKETLGCLGIIAAIVVVPVVFIVISKWLGVDDWLQEKQDSFFGWLGAKIQQFLS